MQDSTPNDTELTLNQKHPKKHPFSLADLSWIVGDWEGLAFDDIVEEHWSIALGNSMMGMFRSVAGEETNVVEFMTIVAVNDDVLFFVKHFNPKSISWDDDSLAYKLIHLTQDEAIFENTSSASDKPRRIIYRKPDERSLTSRTEAWETDENGQPQGVDVSMRRSQRGYKVE